MKTLAMKNRTEMWRWWWRSSPECPRCRRGSGVPAELGSVRKAGRS